jgi:endonuclease YncB( thermonuclease family)
MGCLFSCLSCCSSCTLLPDCCRLRCLKKKKYSFPFKRYHCYVQEVIDGDTFHITFFIKSVPITMKLRLLGVDTPEMSSKNPLEKEVAKEVTEFLKKRIEHRYFPCELIKHDKYGGRVVGKLFYKGRDLTEILLKHSLGKCYEGGNKGEWTEVELNNIKKELVMFRKC